MKVSRLDHVNLRTTQLAEMIDWYEDILGLEQGPRPNFQSAGAWMYAGNSPVVHLVATNDAPGAGSETELKLEHFAFGATGLAGFETKLRDEGIEYHRVDIEDFRITQINIHDPDGNHIHVDFATDE